MKIDPRQAASFLRNPARCRAVLLHGDDEGLIRERGAALTRLVAGSTSDPFQVVELDRSGWASLSDEITAISMMGGRRAIRVRDATDAILPLLKAALLTKGDAMLVVEAPDLGRGKLRTFMEAGADVASIACYPDEGRALHEAVRVLLSEFGVTADADAVIWIAAAVGRDRRILRSEVEKLALLVGDGGRVDLETARSCAGDAAAATADSGMLAATLGDIVAADGAIEDALSGGLAAIAIIRTAISHLHKLQQTRLRMASGQSASDAIKALRPPVFFKSADAMAAAVGKWPLEAVARALEEARQVEVACKQTGSRPDALVRRYVISLSRLAATRTQLRG